MTTDYGQLMSCDTKSSLGLLSGELKSSTVNLFTELSTNNPILTRVQWAITPILCPSSIVINISHIDLILKN